MAFNIKKIRPLFTGVVTTARKYVGDQTTTKGGLLIDTTKMKGQLNMYQQVVAVGTTVHDVKEGDIVMVNFDRYLTAQHVPGKIENNIQSDKFSAKYEIPMVKLDGIDYLFLQQNDIVFVVTEYDGIEGGGLLE